MFDYFTDNVCLIIQICKMCPRLLPELCSSEEGPYLKKVINLNVILVPGWLFVHCTVSGDNNAHGYQG